MFVEETGYADFVAVSLLEGIEDPRCDMIDAETVGETSMFGSVIGEPGDAELPNAPEPLEFGRVDEFEDEFIARARLESGCESDLGRLFLWPGWCRSWLARFKAWSRAITTLELPETSVQRVLKKHKTTNYSLIFNISVIPHCFRFDFG